MIGLEDLKDYLGISDDDTSEDAVLVELEANAVAFVQTQTGRYFGPPEEFEEIVEGSGLRRLWMSDKPVESEYQEDLVEVVERPYPGGTATTLEIATDYEVRTGDRTGWLVRLGSAGRWTSGYEYTLTYYRGYLAGTEPGDIRQLVLDLVSLRRTLKGREALRSETAPDYAYTRFGEGDLDAIPGAWDTIRAWKRLVYA